MATQRTPEGKWVLWLTSDLLGPSGQVMAKAGSQIERWAVDAKVLVASGDASTEAPEGVAAKLPPAPPKSVGVQPSPVVATVTAAEIPAVIDASKAQTRTR